MENNYIEPPEGLLKKVLNRIHREERILVLKRTVILSIILISSLVGIFPAFNAFSSQMNQTGFISFFSLVFSDFSLVATYWQSFMMVLLQTLPALSLAVLLAVLLTLLQSFKLLTKNIKFIINNRLAIN